MRLPNTMKMILTRISGHSQNSLALAAFAKPAGSTNALNIPRMPLAAPGVSSAMSASVPTTWIEYQEIIPFAVRCSSVNSMKFAILLCGLAAGAYAQLAAPNASGVSMGHVHLYSKDPESHKKFWVDVLGASETKLAGMQVFKIPGMLVMVQKADRTGGSVGSMV